MISNKRYHNRNYEDRFVNFSNFIEKIIWKTFILFIIMLILFQFILSFNSIRKLIVPIERMEGTIEYYKVIN